MSNAKHVSWGKTNHLKDVMSSRINQRLNRFVAYGAKVKLHGTNAAIQTRSDGTYHCQSRNRVITPENDNAGFAAWVVEKNLELAKPADGVTMTVFGEFCGEGIMQGVACAQVPKFFAVFAARFDFADGGSLMEYDPAVLADLVTGPGVYALGWHSHANLYVGESAFDQNILAKERINAAVEEVEAEDPFVKAMFDVSGIGEGLVYFPLQYKDPSDFEHLRFKAKGKKHRDFKAKTPTDTLDPKVLLEANAFADAVVTDARVEKALAECGSTPKDIGACIRWVLNDVKVEHAAELAGMLGPRQCTKAVGQAASAKVRAIILGGV